MSAIGRMVGTVSIGLRWPLIKRLRSHPGDSFFNSTDKKPSRTRLGFLSVDAVGCLWEDCLRGVVAVRDAHDRRRLLSRRVRRGLGWLQAARVRIDAEARYRIPQQVRRI